MKIKRLTILFLLLSNLVFAQETNVPDDNFEAFLEANGMGNGIANDDYVTTANISSIVSLDISNQAINNLTGIEGFQALNVLNFDGNTVSSVDLSTNTALIELSAVSNSLTTLNLTANINLRKVDVADNDLTFFDFRNGMNGFIQTFRATANYQLFCINVDDTALSSLVLWNVDSYTSFDEDCGESTIADDNFEAFLEANNMGNGIANDNKVFTVKIKNVTSLDISNQNINSLEGISAFENLNILTANSNNFVSVNLSLNTGLVELYLISNDLTSLDLTANTNLLKVDVADNKLTSFDFRNGNNGAIQTFRAIANYNLPCITVNDSGLSSLSLWNVEAGTSFSEDCNWTYVPDDNFENFLETRDANNNFLTVGDPTSMGNGIANDNYVKTASIENVINLFVQFQNITDFTGIEDFEALEFLSCFSNTINTSLDVTNNKNLKRVDAGGMGLTSINITGLTSLERLSAPRNNLTTVDLSTNTALKDLILSTNTLSGLDVNGNILLEDLQIHETTLSSLDVSTNVNLTKLTASLNQLTELNLENNTLLQRLSCSRNPITAIEISHLTDLDDLNINETEIIALDLSSNTKLTEFSAREMPNLNYINLKNGNNANVTDFEVDDCPNLTCIEVDDPTAGYLTSWTKDAIANFAQYCRFTYVPDDNFENYLETHKENTGGTTIGNENSLGNGVIDDYVPTEKIENLTILFIENQNISDFTGLEEFKGLERFRAYGNPVNGNLDLTANVNLSQLFCWNMGLTGVNLTGLTSLTQLNLEGNNINSLDLTTNTALEDIDIENNNLTFLNVTQNTEITGLNYTNNGIQITDLSQNTKLITLKCSGNTIPTINIQSNTAIETLEIGNNPITNLDVSTFSKLVNLKINDTSIDSIDLSSNPDISQLVCNDTAITELDLSNNANMYTLEVHNNAITALSLSNLTRLNTLNCANNQLTQLNLRNGNNAIIDAVDITGNPNLTCVEVDDPAGSYLSTWSKDATANFNEYCRLTYVPNDNFEALLESRNLGNGIANDDYVYTGLISSEKTLIIQDKDIADLTGIEDFKSLELLICRRSNLETIDLSKSTNLTHLSLVDNSLTNLDLSNNILLEEVHISDNENLGSIDVSALLALTTLDASNTGMSTIAIANNRVLRVLNIDHNNFTSLDISPYSSIVQLRVTNNQLTSLNVANGNNSNFTWFDARDNTNLTCIQVDNVNPDSRLWYKDDTANYALYCELTYIADANFENYLETHDADGNIVAIGDVLNMGNGIANDNQVATSKVATVISLNIESEDIADLTGIEAFAALETLNCDYNKLTTLDLSSNTNLKILDAAENDFVRLDLSGYLALEEVNLRSNSITSLLVNNNPNLKKLNVGKNSLIELDLTSCVQLEELLVHQNLIVTLDVRNGTNTLITKLVASLNPSLRCILVDDINADFSLWTKDVTATYTENCNTIIWDGSTSSAWTLGTNWSNDAVPSITNDVFIPNAVRVPNVTSNVQVNKLEIELSSGFNISSEGSVIVNSDLNANEILTMQSTASNSSVLLVKGNSNGQVSYERGSLSANKWSIVSAPVHGQSIKDFVENPANSIRINTSVIPNRYAVSYYNDSQASGSKWVYYDVDYLRANPNESFEKGRSYAISRETDGGVTFTGTLETSSITKTVAASEWNAIGNPYTAFLPINENSGVNFINDNSIKLNPANVGVYVWDNAQDKYVGKSLISEKSSLAPGQGFFVKTTTGVTDILFNEALREIQPVSGGTFARGITTNKPSIQLLATLKDITVDTNIKYFDNATEGLDPKYDLGNYSRANFDVFTRLVNNEKGEDFTIQSLSTKDIESTVLPVGLKAGVGEEVVFTINTKDLPEGVEVFIEDKLLEKFTKLNATTNKFYSVKITEQTNEIGRFYLHTRQSKTAVVNTDINNVRIYIIENNTLMIDGISKGNFEMNLYAVHGASVLSKTIEGMGKNSIVLPTLQTGVYIVRVVSELGMKTKKIIVK